MDLETGTEIEELAARSYPQSRKYLLQTQQRALEVDAILDMLEVQLVEITQK